MIAKLEMLMALAKEQHFGRAAESMGITQPTLSAGIRQLEGHLGVKLVERGSRYGGLTPEGQRTLVWARQIVGDSRQLREEMRFSRRGLSGHIRLAVIPTALTWAARLTARFSDKHPNVSFSVLSQPSTSLLSMIENLDADAGVTYLDNEPLGHMASVPLYAERYAVLCPAAHPLARKSEIGWTDFNDARLCLLTPDMQNRRILNRNFMEAGTEPQALIESNSTIVLVSNVIESGFVTILPTDLAQFLSIGHDLSVRPITAAGLQPTVGLIARHQEPYTPVLQALMRAARELGQEAKL